MIIDISNDSKELGKKSAKHAAEIIRTCIKKKNGANIILATGASQFETLKNLVQEPEVDWSKVIMFHLDEYAGLPEHHPASFRRYLKDRFVRHVEPLKEVHLINGEASDPHKECRRISAIIADHPIDVALAGIGENGHLAFNDPPADFDTTDPYILVELDEACRRQQMGEGWFKSMDEVPKTAISMSIQQIMASGAIICSVPDKRKAEAVKNCLEGEVTNTHPASVLQDHADCNMFLDNESASLLSKG